MKNTPQPSVHTTKNTNVRDKYAVIEKLARQMTPEQQERLIALLMAMQEQK